MLESQRPHTVVLYAHPAPQRSPLMRALAAAARAMPGVRVQDLYEVYPDFDIDGARERDLLDGASLAVFLHPFRWYGMPSLMKEWMEVVLQPGWAYGGAADAHPVAGDNARAGAGAGVGDNAGAGVSEGARERARGGALQGKGFWLVTSTGGGADRYGAGGLHGRPLGDFLPPFEQAAALCGMDWIDPLVVHGAGGMDDASIDVHAAGFHARLAEHAARYAGAVPRARPPEAPDAA